MCNHPDMATDFTINERLIEQARLVGGHKTNREAVTAALEEYIQRRRQTRILEAFGTVDFDPTYDYKAERNRKRLG
jgi:Bacterial antitoxin of type II TA system, VapB